MSNIINARSPFFIKVDPVGTEVMDGANLDIKIWSGDITPIPTETTYQINKTIIGTNNFINIELSLLIRDFLDTEYYNVNQGIAGVADDAVWVQVVATPYSGETDLTPITYSYLAFDGYGYFNEGSNPRTLTDPTTLNNNYTPQVLQDNRIVFFKRGEDIRIPIFSEPAPSAVTTISGVWDLSDVYWEQSNVNWDATSVPQNIVDSDLSQDKIQYLIIDSAQAVTGDTITITSSVGNSQVDVITLQEIECGKYEDYRVIFYNKFGALQDIYMSKKSTKNLKVKSDSYKRNIFNSQENEYNALRHQKYVFDVTAQESISLNSEFFPEEFNDLVEQIFIAEQIWLALDIQVSPVVIKSSSLKYKTHTNDKLIQYGIDFDYSNSFLNSVR